GVAVHITEDERDEQVHTPVVIGPNHDIDPNDVLPTFDNLLMEAMAGFLRRVDGRQILIPLSGGADSRLLLALLHRLGANNVMTFTYGKANAREPGISRDVAHALGYPWRFVELDAKRMYSQWHRPRTSQFLRDTWTGVALPHIQDWYALTVLANDPDIAPDAVVTPGHTIVGKAHADWSIDPRIPIDTRAMTKILADHHLALQGQSEYGMNVAYARDRITSFLRRWWPNEDPELRRAIQVGYNLEERQAKYISNSVRAYESFGFDWALPMYERPLWTYWLGVPLEFRDSARTRYVHYAHTIHARAAGADVDYITGPANVLPQGPMNIVRTTLEKLHLKQRVDATYRALVELHHPMGYEALVGDLSRAALAARLFGGTSIIGVYCDLFLANRWAPGDGIVPVP
ncbi:MAG: hypothetical protein Q4Q03_06555, partial [Bowdeniella nasicola]|nr:hypothetical protein [Bowdeniella nasicola]